MITEATNNVSLTSGSAEHFVRFYDEDALLLAEVGDFIDTSLRAGGVSIIIATADHVSALRRRLSGIGAEHGGLAWLPERLITFDAEQMLSQFMVNEWPDESLFNATVGEVIRTASADAGKVHAFGEMVALLCAQGLFDAALHLEKMWNALAVETSFSLFCAYPWKLFPTAATSAAFQQICESHDHAGDYTKHVDSTDIIELANTKHINLKLVKLEQKARSLEAEVARRIEAESTLRQREKELTDFFDNSAEGLHRVGPDGTILWANKAELSMLGYRAEEYIGKHITYFHVDPAVIEGILAKLNSGETIYDYPARLWCKNRSIKHVVINSNACFENGQLRYTRCFTRDATDRYLRDEAYTEGKKLLAQLTNANQAKDEFLAMLGHELRNPLGPIVMALELMRMRNNEAHFKEREVIDRQVKHMHRLVEDLLDISRITRGRIELMVCEMDVSQALNKAIEMANPLLVERNHKLNVNIEDGLLMSGDPVRVAQVVANLLTNSARYTDKGGDIVLSANSVNRDNKNWIRISVKDNGVGLSELMLEQIFEMFFQAPQKIDRAQGGLGIGLSLVKNIVELHGGTVEAKSAGIGQGSEFILQLPIGALPIETTPISEEKGLTQVVTKRRIILVDDNLDALDALGTLLELSGHLVESFHNPIAALSAIERFKPEIAILDIGLPVLDGYELAIQMRTKLNAPCSFIALTGYGQEGDRIKSKVAGFEQHFVKPVNVDKIIEFIDTVS